MRNDEDNLTRSACAPMVSLREKWNPHHARRIKAARPTVPVRENIGSVVYVFLCFHEPARRTLPDISTKLLFFTMNQEHETHKQLLICRAVWYLGNWTWNIGAVMDFAKAKTSNAIIPKITFAAPGPAVPVRENTSDMNVRMTQVLHCYIHTRFHSFISGTSGGN